MTTIDTHQAYEETRATLVDQLKRHRREKALTGDQVSQLVQERFGKTLSQSKLSKIENLRMPPSTADVEILVAALGVPDNESKTLLKMAKILENESASWSTLQKHGSASHQAEILELESCATSIAVLQTVIIPGLLQTAPYIREVLTQLSSNRRDIDAAVAVRLERQQTLDIESKRFEFIISEAILRKRLLEQPQLEMQLDRIVALSKRPNIRLGVLEIDSAKAPILWNSFSMYDHQTVIAETLTQELVIRSADDVTAYRDVLQSAENAALFGDDARALVKRIRDQLKRPTKTQR